MNKQFEPEVHRGEIFYAVLGHTVGSEQRGTCPVLIIQNDKGNAHSPTVIVAVLTSKVHKKSLPTHVMVGTSCGLAEPSLIMFEQILTIDRQRLRQYIGKLNQEELQQVEKAIHVSLGVSKE